MIAIIDAILFILLRQKAPQLCPIQTFPGSWHCFSPWSVFLLLSYTHLSLKQGQQSLSTHILQIPKQILSKVETCVCTLTLELTSVLIVCFTKTMSSYSLLR